MLDQRQKGQKRREGIKRDKGIKRQKRLKGREGVKREGKRLEGIKGLKGNRDKKKMDKKYGHEKMVIYQNIDRIDMMVQREILPKIPRYYFKTKTQIDSASDSVGSNFVEGYYSSSLKEYLRFLGYSKRSLAEAHERVRRCYRKCFIDEILYLKFKDLYNMTMYLFSRLIGSLEEKL